MISLLTAGVLAIVAFRLTQDLFLTVFFAFFALSNYQILQSMHVQSRYGLGDGDDDDWWRRRCRRQARSGTRRDPLVDRRY